MVLDDDFCVNYVDTVSECSKAANRGLIPQHYDAAQRRRALSGYVNDCLKEEVVDEGLTRSAQPATGPSARDVERHGPGK